MRITDAKGSIMFKPRCAQFLTLAVAFGMVFVCSVPSFAQLKFLEHIRRKYMMDKTNGKCNLCHELKTDEDASRKNLNIFGKKIQADPEMKPLLGKDDKFVFGKEHMAILEKVVAKYEQEDTDGDGVSNLEEIDLGSFPADPKSQPDKLALKKFRAANPDKAFKGAAATPAPAPAKEAMRK